MAASIPCSSLNKINKEERDHESIKMVERSYQRYREIISTLPQEKGWIAEDMCLYEGFWYQPTHGLPGVMFAQEHFQARPDDVLLISTPKSGTTWFKAIIFAIVKRTCYTNSTHPLLTTNPHDCVPFFEFLLFLKPPVEDVDNLPSPRIFATHIPYTSLPNSIMDSGCKIVYVCRDPKDVLISMWYFLAKMASKGVSTHLCGRGTSLPSQCSSVNKINKEKSDESIKRLESSYQRCRVINLPKEKGWTADEHLNRPAPHGSNLKALISAIMKRTCYTNSTHPLLSTNPRDCVPFLKLKIFTEPPVVDVDNLPSPRLFATHNPYTSLLESILRSGCKIVYLCRDPKDYIDRCGIFWPRVDHPRSLQLKCLFHLSCKECGVAKRRGDGKLSTSAIGGSTKILGSRKGTQSCSFVGRSRNMVAHSALFGRMRVLGVGSLYGGPLFGRMRVLGGRESLLGRLLLQCG
ncbi:hypothetical protein RHMOL_Rhmol01G0067100 [Rhododendron molle]|uniref:Uncharacterized protein n=1 Tax=Rhododendron molle TaxID=49168 RepID=A0ACC0Q082_RHOML|nr:hypothetical protein RHMOL_Rhmol01G0067100 [Rhododendron molle]